MFSRPILTILALSLAAPAFATDITVSVTSAVNPNADSEIMPAVERCILTVSATNNTDEKVDFSTTVWPEMVSYSTSKFTFEILNKEPKSVFTALEAGQSASEEIDYSALSCDHVESLTFGPSCVVSGSDADCSETITASEDSIFSIVMPHAGAPTGPLHGTWGAFSEDAVQYLTVSIIDDLSGEFTAAFQTTDAFCEVALRETGCAEGWLDKEVRILRGDQERLFLILNLTDNPNKDQVEFTMSTLGETGQLRNTSSPFIKDVAIRRID